MAPRPAARSPRLAIPVALLLAVLGLVAALAYKALEADRSHRAGAERTLRDYAEFATWEYAVRAQRSVLTVMGTAFAYTMASINPDLPGDSLPSVAGFARVARGRGTYCRCLDGVRFFFRYDWRGDSLATVGDTVSRAVRRWVRDTVTAHPRIFPPPQGFAPLAFGGTSSGEPLRRLSVLITNDSYVVLFDRVEGHDYAVVYVLSRDYENEPFVTYGFVTDAAAFAQPVFGTAFKREELLPPTLLRGIPDDTAVLAVQVSDIMGRPLFRSAASFPTTYAARDTLDATFGRVVVQAALRPEFAGRLVVGGLPQSQLPLLAGIFLLTAALLIGALYQLRRQHELARLRTDFVSGVSHELRTPLTQIRLFAELLRNRALRTDQEREHALRVVDQEARRLTYLVENVLDFSRGERRLNRVAPVQTEVTEVIRDTLGFFAPVAAAKSVRLRADLPPQLWAVLDPAALRQILINLLDNAVKYGPPAQTVRVAARLEGGVLRLSVDDEGPGIPEGEGEQIWEPYHRLQRDMDSAVG
ncbi:MAG TPA: HAMP domain-containing sensor histidine kinase, partial [Gemmatimonadaceae bacterium]|nr:HAMP domain-containing sensor histidine kinase [Gemmatimonadaceae bacterium]